MKKIIERMNNSVIAEQLAAKKASGGSKLSEGSGKDKDGKKKWPLFSRKSSTAVGKQEAAAPQEEEEVEGMRVDFYLVVFLKFIASIVPTIEVDSTTSF
jgi:ubiquitin-like-conjugating enzyme ATG3